MILSGKEIEKNINKEIIIEPFDLNQLNPNSYNLSLHNELLIYDNNQLDMKKDNAVSKVIISNEGYLIEPGKIYLGRTKEYTETKSFIPTIEGRSSLGRLGISIHISSPYGNIGFKGFWTLEISCIQPVIIYPDVNICQIYYHQISGEYNHYSSKKYQNNEGIQSSKLFEELS